MVFPSFGKLLQNLVATIHKAGGQYLSQESQMLDNQVGAFCLPRATFSTDDNALTQKTRVLVRNSQHRKHPVCLAMVFIEHPPLYTLIFYSAIYLSFSKYPELLQPFHSCLLFQCVDVP